MILDQAVATFILDHGPHHGIAIEDAWAKTAGPRAADWYAQRTYVITLNNGYALIARQLEDTVTLVLQNHRGDEVRRGDSRPWVTVADTVAAMTRYAA